MAQQRPRATKSRTPLSRERVLDAAMRLADEDGIESLSMRKLARELGVEAMSLYHHVANKEDLVHGLLGRVADEIEFPSAADDWEESIRRTAISAHAALRRHTWAAAPMLAPSTGILPKRIEYMEALLGCLRDAGLPPDLTYHAYHVIEAHIFGFSLWQAGHSFSSLDLGAAVADFRRQFPPGEFPHISEHIDQHMSDGPHREVSAFELALDLILEGLRRAREPDG